MIHRGSGGTTVEVTFSLPPAVGGSEVCVCGDFNGWSPTADPLVRRPDGGFEGTVVLPAGRCWRFRYLIDGVRWENDWAADDYAPNGYGGQDSVVDLRTESAPSRLATPAPARPD